MASALLPPERRRKRIQKNYHLAALLQDVAGRTVAHNPKRSHQGYRLKGRTPVQAFREALGIEELPPLAMDLNASKGEDTLEAA